MFQRGTGERFKYKEAVKAELPDAICKSVDVNGYNQGTKLIRRLYAIYNNDKRISEAYNRAEDAWSDAWIKLKNK